MSTADKIEFFKVIHSTRVGGELASRIVKIPDGATTGGPDCPLMRALNDLLRDAYEVTDGDTFTVERMAP